MLAQLPIDIYQYPPWMVASVIGGVATVVALVIGIIIARDRGPRWRPPPPAPEQVVPAGGTGGGETAGRERRTALRRGGNPIPILISDAEASAPPFPGYVFDRSTGGLGVLVEEPVAPGTILSIRTVNAPETISWIQVEVKSCRQTEENYEMGCQFVKPPPWHILLLFG